MIELLFLIKTQKWETEMELLWRIRKIIENRSFLLIETDLFDITHFSFFVNKVVQRTLSLGLIHIIDKDQ